MQNEVSASNRKAGYAKGQLTRMQNKLLKANSQKKTLQTKCNRAGQKIKELHQHLHEAHTAEAATRTEYIQLRSAQRQNAKQLHRSEQTANNLRKQCHRQQSEMDDMARQLQRTLDEVRSSIEKEVLADLQKQATQLQRSVRNLVDRQKEWSSKRDETRLSLSRLKQRCVVRVSLCFTTDNTGNARIGHYLPSAREI